VRKQAVCQKEPGQRGVATSNWIKIFSPVSRISFKVVMVCQRFRAFVCPNHSHHLSRPDLAIVLAVMAMLYEEKENGMGMLLDCVDLRPCPSGWLLF
jgi:hypothetical protein